MAIWGSSPRVRGKLTRAAASLQVVGLIPARAGKTPTPPSPAPSSWAHPRACGENVVWEGVGMRAPGSSPRVRGKPGPGLQEAARGGLIPARAGKTSISFAAPRCPPAHPRACGENMQQSAGAVESVGSSPRVRGKLAVGGAQVVDDGLIPARAGKTTRAATPKPGCAAHPRACGENPTASRP